MTRAQRGAAAKQQSVAHRPLHELPARVPHHQHLGPVEHRRGTLGRVRDELRVQQGRAPARQQHGTRSLLVSAGPEAAVRRTDCLGCHSAPGGKDAPGLREELHRGQQDAAVRGKRGPRRPEALGVGERAQQVVCECLEHWGGAVADRSSDPARTASSTLLWPELNSCGSRAKSFLPSGARCSQSTCRAASHVQSDMCSRSGTRLSSAEKRKLR